jgi:hypothetical protein
MISLWSCLEGGAWREVLGGSWLEGGAWRELLGGSFFEEACLIEVGIYQFGVSTNTVEIRLLLQHSY